VVGIEGDAAARRQAAFGRGDQPPRQRLAREADRPEVHDAGGGAPARGQRARIEVQIAALSPLTKK
jgi:hypothetical protein